MWKHEKKGDNDIRLLCFGCFFQSKNKLHGHFSRGHAVYNGEKNDFYYVDRAIIALIDKMKRNGIKKKDITVMIIGGGDVLKNDKNISYISIGEMNVQSAVNTLKKEGFKIYRKITGGSRGRKVIFYPHTGRIIVKNLPSEYNIQYSDLYN